MVEKGEKDSKDKRKRQESTSSSSSASSTGSSGKRNKSPVRRSRSPRAQARADRGEKATVASSRRSPSPERRRRRTPLSPKRRGSPSPKRRASPSPKRRSSSSPKRRDRSISKDRDRPRDRDVRRERSRSKDRKAASPGRRGTPPPRRLCVRNLSRNVTKEHLNEIFSIYGAIKNCEMPMDRQHTHLGRGYGYVEFEQPEDADKAMKHMDGGQIDGQEVTCELTHPPRTTVNSGGRRPISPLRYRGGSPRRYRSPPFRGRGTGANIAPLGPSRFNRSRSRSPRRRRSRS
ncbi:unnamed protein product [Dracunculus medinensis]|uniref:RRM domain-containing protein n=1 Tax=Dracunculus medinensis TaxID=318479 RepID=A0A0N4UJM5_DRAME|nr:unnamed protein product [Dracunculus medinensis]